MICRLLRAVGQQPLNVAFLAWVEGQHPVEHALDAGRLATPEVAFHVLGAHDHTCAGHFEAAGRSLVGLHFGHGEMKLLS